MAAKIITFLLILGINVAIGVSFVFFLMVALNGFNERDANYAFIIFIAGGLLISFLMGFSGIFLLNFFVKKEWNPFLASGISVLAFTALGFLLKIVIFFVGILAADIIRKSR